MELYKRTESVTNIPWYYLAAIDQYERNVRQARKDIPKAEGITGIYFTPEKWAGIIKSRYRVMKILFLFNFLMEWVSDGDGDGKASLSSDEDVLYSFAHFILNYGVDHDNIKLALWDYYKRDKTVSIIVGKAKIYKHFGHLGFRKSCISSSHP